MDHMAGMAHTSSATAATATSTAAATTAACKVSMLWNWHTIDSCFLAQSWHVHTRAQFAGTCIFVFCLVLALEFVRRAQREYDQRIVREWQASATRMTDSAGKSADGDAALGLKTGFLTPLTFRPTVVQQAIRCAFYTVQFGAAYLIMLLAMYFNGYIIISILLGAFVGHFLFGYENITIGRGEARDGNVVLLISMFWVGICLNSILFMRYGGTGSTL